MTVVLVNGNPETPVVWDLLVQALLELGHEEPVRLGPPGFGGPVPAGWGATVEDYRVWLVGELEAIGQPVDLVGHDWGGNHVVNVAMTRPDLLRSWCSDTLGIFDPEYVWHEFAQTWQRPGDGEADVAARLAAPHEVTRDQLVAVGMSPTTAERLAGAFDEDMASVILPLYRSAVQPVMAELGAGLEQAAARPGLAMHAVEDWIVGSEAQIHRSARRAGARVELLPGQGHWWMTTDPSRGARALHEFWAAV